jgi:anti-sigma regulatory factor (Ser/Thr protein kinase)
MFDSNSVTFGSESDVTMDIKAVEAIAVNLKNEAKKLDARKEAILERELAVSERENNVTALKNAIDIEFTK